MELKQVNFGYSLKNIPVPSRQTYLRAMLGKLEHFIKHLQWKAFFFDKKVEDPTQDEKGGNASDLNLKKHPHSTKGIFTV